MKAVGKQTRRVRILLEFPRVPLGSRLGSAAAPLRRPARRCQHTGFDHRNAPVIRTVITIHDQPGLL